VGAPILVQVGDEDLHARQGRVDVAVDRAGRGDGHGLGLLLGGEDRRTGAEGHC
jgi:hypothetical protein